MAVDRVMRHQQGVVDAVAFAQGADGRRRDGADVEVATVASSPSTSSSIDRMAWTGTKHVALHDQLVDLARNVWKLSALVVDATGVGAGLASFLADQRGRGPRRMIISPFLFEEEDEVRSRLGLHRAHRRRPD